jgi:hypothetical protein
MQHVRMRDQHNAETPYDHESGQSRPAGRNSLAQHAGLILAGVLGKRYFESRVPYGTAQMIFRALRLTAARKPSAEWTDLVFRAQIRSGQIAPFQCLSPSAAAYQTKPRPKLP